MSSATEAGPMAGASVGDGIHPVVWHDGAVVMIDQRRLPSEEVYLRYETWQQVADAICTMVVRGAPALGVAAGMGMVLAARAALRAGAGEPVPASRRDSGLRSKLHLKAYSKPVQLPITFPGRLRRWSASGVMRLCHPRPSWR
jgi:hypothetical protein